MAKIVNHFPEVTIVCADINGGAPIAMTSNVTKEQWQAKVMMPANPGNADIIYRFDCHLDGKPSGKFVNVTVLCEIENRYYGFDSIAANPDVISHTGGEANITINLKLVPNPNP